MVKTLWESLHPEEAAKLDPQALAQASKSRPQASYPDPQALAQVLAQALAQALTPILPDIVRALSIDSSIPQAYPQVFALSLSIWSSNPSSIELSITGLPSSPATIGTSTALPSADPSTSLTVGRTWSIQQEHGRRGGLKGGSVRRDKLTPERRSEIAKQAAATRWKKKAGIGFS